MSEQTKNNSEEILNEDNHRYVLFPLKYNSLFDLYKKF